jgi:hypothetical protein
VQVAIKIVDFQVTGPFIEDEYSNKLGINFITASSLIARIDSSTTARPNANPCLAYCKDTSNVNEVTKDRQSRQITSSNSN